MADGYERMFSCMGSWTGEIYMNQPNEFENEVGVISQYMQSLKNSHLDEAQQILR